MAAASASVTAPPRRSTETALQRREEVLDSQQIGALFGDLDGGFADAASALGSQEFDIVLAGSRIRLRFAGEGLRPVILPAFSHLAAPVEAQPDARIDIWEGGRDGAEAEWGRLLERSLDAAPQLTVVGERLVATYDRTAGSLTAVDRGSRHARFVTPAASGLDWGERGAPIRTALHWLVDEPGRRLMHAAAVGRDGDAVLLTGPSGSGKSTLSLACLEAGLDFLGDDYVLIELGSPPRVHSVHATAKVDAGSLRLLPGLREEVTVAAGEGLREKAVIDLSRSSQGQLRRDARLRAVLMPRLGAQRSALRAVGAREAVLALAPTTTFQMPDLRGHSLALAVALAKQVPAYVLELDGDPRSGASVIEEMLAADG